LECWEEGEAFKKIKQRLSEIMAEKEEIEKLKKNRNKNKSLKKGTSLPSVPVDGFNSNSSMSVSR
jgi:hypothetical protein